MARRRTDKAVEALREAANEVSESVTFTVSDLMTLPPAVAVIKLLAEIETVRRAWERQLDKAMADEPADRIRRTAIIQEGLASLDASEMRLRRLASRDGEFSDKVSN